MAARSSLRDPARCNRMLPRIEDTPNAGDHTSDTCGGCGFGSYRRSATTMAPLRGDTLAMRGLAATVPRCPHARVGPGSRCRPACRRDGIHRPHHRPILAPATRITPGPTGSLGTAFAQGTGHMATTESCTRRSISKFRSSGSRQSLQADLSRWRRSTWWMRICNEASYVVIW